MRKLMLVLPLLLFACAPKKAAGPTPQEAPLPQQVRVVVARQGVLEREIRASANLQAEKDSLVAAGTAGKVLRTLPAGTQVRAGDGVVFLDPAPLKEAVRAARLNLRQAEVNLEQGRLQQEGNRAALLAQREAARAQLEAAQKRYQEGQALLQVGALAPLDLKGLEAQFRQAESAYQNALEALNRLERAEDLKLLELQVAAARLQVQQAERNLRESVVRAPFAGEVVEVFAKEGEFLGTGSRAFRLATTGALRAKLYLPPDQAATLTPQTPFLLRQNGLEVPARFLRRTEFPGQNRLVEVVLQPEGRLLPGPAEARYRLRVAEGILLPAGAVQAREGEAVVYRVLEGRAQRTRVRLVAQEGSQAVVEGLPEGSRVVYPIPEGLEEGNPVEVLP